MNIISGTARNLQLADLPGMEVRPTSGRARKALFDSLGDFSNCGVLDLCSGSGALALESASRGAAWAAMVEKDPLHYKFICSFIDKLQDLSAVPVRGDVFQYLARCREQFDFIFADPPYALPQLESIPDCVMGHSLLRPDGLFVLEHGKTNDFSSHPCFVEERTYGSVHFSFFQEKE